MVAMNHKGKKIVIWFCVSYVLLKKHNAERLRLALDLAGGNWLFVAVPLVSLCSTCQREKV
jgi:hypothetical protein